MYRGEKSEGTQTAAGILYTSHHLPVKQSSPPSSHHTYHVGGARRFQKHRDEITCDDEGRKRPRTRWHVPHWLLLPTAAACVYRAQLCPPTLLYVDFQPFVIAGSMRVIDARMGIRTRHLLDATVQPRGVWKRMDLGGQRSLAREGMACPGGRMMAIVAALEMTLRYFAQHRSR